MSTLSVPLTSELAATVERLVRDGIGANKADVARKAIEFFAQEQAVRQVLQASREAKEGKILRGDLDELLEQV